MQQDNLTTKAKSTGRKIIDGLFGNRNARQQQDRVEELQQKVQENARLVAVQKDKLDYVSSVSRQASTSVSELIKTLSQFAGQEAEPFPQDLYDKMRDDAERLSDLIQQLNIDETIVFDDVEEKDGNSTHSSSASSRPIVVLATDDEATGMRLKTVLSPDYEIHKCRNGWQALADVYRNPVDAVVVQAHMDNVDGLTVCRRLRSNPQTSLLPIIVLVDDGDQRFQAMEHGADMCLESSVEPRVMVSSVNNLLKVRQQLRLDYEQQLRAKQYDLPLQKKKSANEKLIERVMDTIYRNLKDSSLSVDMIADEVGMSRVHLHRKMKEIIGQTPHDFIRQLRLERAARLLASGDTTITEVVYACGFTNTASFSTIFKNVYGLSPTEYMAEKQKSNGE